MTRARSRQGFTLVEVLIVVGFLAILASMILPAIRASQTQTLDSSARVLAADLRLARSLAIQFNTEWTVEFDLVNNQYELVHTGSGTPPAARNALAGTGEAGGTYVVALDHLGSSRGGSSGIQLAGAALRDARTDVTDVTFGPLGGTGPGRSEDTVIWLTTGSGDDVRYVRMIVSWVTGQVWVDPVGMYDAGDADQLFE